MNGSGRTIPTTPRDGPGDRSPPAPSARTTGGVGSPGSRAVTVRRCTTPIAVLSHPVCRAARGVGDGRSSFREDMASSGTDGLPAPKAPCQPFGGTETLPAAAGRVPEPVSKGTPSAGCVRERPAPAIRIRPQWTAPHGARNGSRCRHAIARSAQTRHLPAPWRPRAAGRSFPHGSQTEPWCNVEQSWLYLIT